MICVKKLPPIPPKLDMVNVPPFNSAGFYFLFLALLLMSTNSIDKSDIDF